MIRNLEPVERKKTEEEVIREFARRFAGMILDYAEHSYSRHKAEGYLDYVNFEGEEFSLIADRAKAHLFQYSKTGIDWFADELKSRMQKDGFRSAAVKCEWTSARIQRDIASTKKTKIEGYTVHIQAEW